MPAEPVLAASAFRAEAERIALSAACELLLWPSWLAAESESLFVDLFNEIAWEQGSVRLFGKSISEPRLSLWIGDEDAVYSYSQVRREPRPWTPTTMLLRDRLEAALGIRFNSVLANLYRDGQDSMGFHADDEAELGEAPIIASISLGGTRRFVLKRQGQRRELSLAAGSLLVMDGDTQAQWKHGVPKTARPVSPRINLTYRRIFPTPRP